MASILRDDRTLEEDLRVEHTFRCETLFLVLECERPFSGSLCLDLNDIDEVRIGRGAERTASRRGDGQLLITVPDARISSAHARLWRADGGWFIEDLDSRNGTVVRGERVPQTWLEDGCVFSLGHTCFSFASFNARTRPAPADREVAVPVDGLGLTTLQRQLQERLDELVAVARDGVPIVIEGEPGTGKEKLARAVHERAGRTGAFVELDCRAAQGVEGAPWSVHFEQALARAELGTLFLRDVDELDVAAQACLLGAIEQHERFALSTLGPTRAPRLIGSVKPHSLGPLGRTRMRRDLYASIAGFVFTCAPLRRRREDLGLLLPFFLRQAGGRVDIDVDFFCALIAHDWPGNLRELEQYARTATALAGGARISHLPTSLSQPIADEPAPPPVSGCLEPDPAFVRDVRRALRGGLTVASLKDCHSLLSSSMVGALTQGSDSNVVRVQRLREIMLRTVELLRLNPRREKLYEVVQLTFITPARTQYETAERLAMAFGTYRRHVTAAIAELVFLLWFEEQQARMQVQGEPADSSRLGSEDLVSRGRRSQRKQPGTQSPQ